MNCVGIVFVHTIFQIPQYKAITRVEVRRTWWPRPSTAKTLRKLIWNDIITKMLTKEIQNFVCHMWSNPILLEERFLELKTHTWKKCVYHNTWCCNEYAILSNNDSGSSTFSLSTVLINTKIIPVCQVLKNIHKQLKLESFLSILYMVLMNMLTNVSVPCFVTKWH
jgi:hypothetical protein